MDFISPDLVLAKMLKGEVRSFFCVQKIKRSLVVLVDIEHGGTFKFDKQVVQDLVNSGVLRVISASDIPNSVYLPKKEIEQDISDPKSQAELERRFSYVKGAVDSDITGYTEKRLRPFISLKAQELDDPQPPAWRTLAHWISIYLKSGSKKKSLRPKHGNKGNRDPRGEPEVNRIRDKIVAEHCKKSLRRVRYQSAYRDYLAEIEKENEQREKQGLEPLKPCSYESLRRQFR